MTGDIKQLNQMTDLINDIADQTKLLALNAAIQQQEWERQGKDLQ